MQLTIKRRLDKLSERINMMYDYQSKLNKFDLMSDQELENYLKHKLEVLGKELKANKNIINELKGMGVN